jgi:lysosomal acid lipase/cholesteryl ester hydrolase
MSVCMSGNNYCLNNSAVDVFLQYEPQPTSTKTMIHLAQSTTLFVPK